MLFYCVDRNYETLSCVYVCVVIIKEIILKSNEYLI